MKSDSVSIEECAQFSFSAVTNRFTLLIFQRSVGDEAHQLGALGITAK